MQVPNLGSQIYGVSTRKSRLVRKSRLFLPVDAPFEQSRSSSINASPREEDPVEVVTINGHIIDRHESVD